MTDTPESPITLDQVLTQRRDAHQEIVNVDEPQIKLVIFALADQFFAFPGERIREILAEAEVFFVPGCPPSLEGVINVRGDIESVIRLHDLLRLPAPEAHGQRGTSILLGKSSAMRSGIRVDRVMDVVDLPASRVQPPPTSLPEHLRAVVTGVLQFNELPVAVLDLETLFADYAKGLG
jgi:purine-binding chemotaxis protein CheW